MDSPFFPASPAKSTFPQTYPNSFAITNSVDDKLKAPYTMTKGGPGTSTTNLPFAIYQQMFQKYQYGQAAAAGVVVVIASIVIATYSLRLISSLFQEEVSR